MKKTVGVIIGACLLATATACNKKEETAPPAQAPSVAVGVPSPGSPEILQKGRQLFSEKCSGCHTINKVGGRGGPDLSNVGTRRDALYIRSLMQNPKAYNPTSTMPSFADMPKGDLDALVAYLLTLK